MNAHSASSNAPAIFPREPQHVGKFECLMRLGQGGMATVYLARSVSSGGFQRLAAIKVMHQFLSADGQFVEMFLDEARVAANLRHPNVVSIVDLSAEGENLYMVMDYVEGDTLAAVEGTAARLGRAIPLGIVLRVVLDALAGLDAAHELKTPDGVDLKVVHRDVSPQNILVGVDGASRLTDFGIARAEQRIATTRTGMLKGKAPFMAPEQFEGKPVDRRADVFAMGVTLWEAVALRRLYPGRENYEHAVRNARAPYRRLKDILPSTPASLDEVLKRSLAPNVADRYSSAAAFADAIEGEFRSIIASHRQVGVFMSAVASEKIERERSAIRTPPKPRPVADRARSVGRQRPAPYGIGAGDISISASALKAFESRPPDRFSSAPPANDTHHKSASDDADDDPEVAAALRALDEMPVTQVSSRIVASSAARDPEGASQSTRELRAPAIRPAPPESPSHVDADLPVALHHEEVDLPQRISGDPTIATIPAHASRAPAARQRTAAVTLQATARPGPHVPHAGLSVGPPRRSTPIGASFTSTRPHRSGASLPSKPSARSTHDGPAWEPPQLDKLLQTSAKGSRRFDTDIPDTTMEFDLITNKARAEVDRPKPLFEAPPLVSSNSVPDSGNNLAPTRPIAPQARIAQPIQDAPRVEHPLPPPRFPSLVPVKQGHDWLLDSRWVPRAVLFAVLLVLGFVLTRGF